MVTIVLVLSVALLLLLLLGPQLSRLRRLEAGLRKRSSVRVTGFGTLCGEAEGGRFGLRIFRARDAWWTVVFLETQPPPFEFMIRAPAGGVARVPSTVPVLQGLAGGPAKIGTLLAAAVVLELAEDAELYRTFRPQPSVVAVGLPDGVFFHTEDPHALQGVVDDPRFAEAVRRLLSRPGLSYLLVRTLPRSRVRLVRDGFALLVPFRGRSGLALLRDNPPGKEPGTEEIFQDLAALGAAWTAIGWADDLAAQRDTRSASSCETRSGG